MPMKENTTPRLLAAMVTQSLCRYYVDDDVVVVGVPWGKYAEYRR